MQGMGVFFLLILVMVFRAFSRAAGKGQTGAAGKNGQKPPAAGSPSRKPAGPEARTGKRNSGWISARDRAAESGRPASAAAVPETRGSLGGGSMEGVDPCHDDPYAVPSGSLGGESAEGIDPCHDDPYAVPSGSLGGGSTEGTDPCHDGWKPAGRPAAPETEAREPGGLQLSWAGNDIVKGFVYGEILRRKAG